MKKLLALILAVIMLAAALASCASAPKAAYSANVRVTSSDAESAAAWLTSRLGDKLTDSVVLGTDAAGCGVDLSALENDGYVIRSLGDEVALFARTASGLDRAARKYAKTVESGAAVTDVTYHEGFRVGAIMIAGRDISEYTVYCEDEYYMRYYANDFAARIKEACGAELAVAAGEPSAPYIAFKYVHDESLSTCGYRWSVSDDGLLIECSDGYKPSAAYCAVTRFLETRLGWFGLSYGFPDLERAERISIASGESGGETNVFTYANLYGDQYTSDAFTRNAPLFSSIPNCCHGMQSHQFAGELSKSGEVSWSADQPCYLSEEFFDLSCEDVAAYIESQLSSGAVIGESFFFVDIAAGDNGNWCGCKDCRKMLAAEGSVSASVVTWANRLSETLNETYPGLVYGIFAYSGTNRPPKTVAPNEHLYITYCFDLTCDKHCLDGSICNGEDSHGIWRDRVNDVMSANLEGWLDFTKNVYVWFYGMDQGFLTMNYVYTIRDNLRYFARIGVKGVFWEAEDRGFSLGKAAKWAASALLWDADMTDEEYSDHLDRVLAELYGDGAPYVRDLCDVTAAIQKNGICAYCWFGAASPMTLVPELVEPEFDTMFALTEAALRSVDSERQEYRMVKLAANSIYTGCVSSYFDAYDAGDDERVAELSRRYALIEEYLGRFGMSPNTSPDFFYPKSPYWRGGVWASEYVYESDMEVMAWATWRPNADSLALTVPDRPMPERVAAILAERENED